MRTKVLTAASAASLALLTGLLSSPTQAADGKITHTGHKQVLIVKHDVKSACTVIPNFPGGASNKPAITIPAGGTLKWRYNVGSKAAAVSIPGAAFPSWGFVTDRGCLGLSQRTEGNYKTYRDGQLIKTYPKYYPAGKPIPTTTLMGRSQQKTVAAKFATFRKVDWRPAHGAIGEHSIAMPNNSTFRDFPNRFVIGNVYQGWHVRSTEANPKGWTKVYVPNIKRFGYVLIR